MPEEEHKEEHKEPEKDKGGMFGKHKTLWIVGGVGAAGVLLLLFMNGNSSGGSQGSSQGTQGTQDLSQIGAGGAVDTSSLVGSGGYPSWYNPGTAENLDYWPYVPNSNSDPKSGTGSSSSSSGSKSGSKSGSGSKSSSGSKSGSGSKSSSGSKSGSKSGSGSKSSSGGVSHGTTHGVSSGSTSKKKAVSPNVHAGGAHGYVYVTKPGDTLSSLQNRSWGTSGGVNILGYANNAKLLKSQGFKLPGTKSTTSNRKSYNQKLKPGTKIVL